MTKTLTPVVGFKTSPTSRSTQTPKATRTPKLTPTPKPTVTPTPEVKNVLTIHLKIGLHWSDGSALLARDLVGAYNISWAQNNSVWFSIKDVIARDDYTIDFLISKPSPLLLYQVLRSSPIAPYSQYGTWMDQAGDARKAGYKPDSPEVKKLLDELYAFKPASVAASGPFVLKPVSVTTTKLELVKNPSGYNADRIDIDRIVVYYARAADSTTMVLYNKIDYSAYPYSTSELDRFKNMGNMQVMRVPTGAGPGLWFNEAIYPLDKKEVRQAFAYIIDRDQNASAAVGEAGEAINYLTGLTDTQAETWLDPETISRLNLYKKDWTRAEDLLKSAGCARDAHGKWVDDRGKPMSYELLAPAEKADWLKAAEDVASQLTDFGIQAAVKTYPLTDRFTIQKEGKYQILTDLGDYYSAPFPYAPFAYYMTKPHNNPEATDNLFGMKWPWKQVGPDGQVYDIPKLLNAASNGLDFKSQKSAAQTLALILNDQLPVLPLFESYTATPINTGTRVDGWLASDDPIYRNSQQADNPVAIQFLDGKLKRSAGGDGSFTTVAAYPRTQAYAINYFKRNNMLQNVGTFSYNIMYPPLFWFMWADGDYMPVLAESFEFR
jgi:peptide/nickel transport system substrate-binding protein